MKTELVGKLIGVVVAFLGGILAIKAGAQKPPNFVLVILGMALAFLGRFIGERAKDF